MPEQIRLLTYAGWRPGRAAGVLVDKFRGDSHDGGTGCSRWPC